MPRAVGGVACGLGFAVFLLATLGMDGSGRYPLAYSQLLIGGIAMLLVISGLRDWREARAAIAAHPDRVPDDTPGGTGPMLATVVLSIAYAAAWPFIGFLLATFIYVATQLWLLRQRGWLYLLGVPAGVTLLVWLVFAQLLLLPLPGGMLFGD